MRGRAAAGKGAGGIYVYISCCVWQEEMGGERGNAAYDVLPRLSIRFGLD